MKRRRSSLILILLFICSVITACSKSDIENENDYERSVKAWVKFKETANNSYQYEVSQYSWPDHRSVTLISVTNGKVTKRHYKSVFTEGLKNMPAETMEWTENENDLNTHKDSPAAQAITLDEVYNLAKTNWLLKRKGSQPTFEAKNNGMISTCGFSAEGCVDDCFVGINITSIVAL